MNEQLLLSYQADIALLRGKLEDGEMAGISMSRRPSANNEIQRQIQAREDELEEMRASHELLLSSQTEQIDPIVDSDSDSSLDLTEETIIITKRELERLKEEAGLVAMLQRTIKESDARLRARDLYLNNRYLSQVF